MTRLERAQRFNHEVRAQHQAITTTIPHLSAEGMILANGDAAKARKVVSAMVASVSLLEARPWVAGMTTAPGELVEAPDKKYLFAYSGKEPMTHGNPLFYPGASGVYYWAVVPNVKDGIPLYPDLPGIIVAVKKNQLWWDVAGTSLYRWTAADWSDCSYPPGAPGVHQWVKEAAT